MDPTTGKQARGEGHSAPVDFVVSEALAERTYL
jgi:hypothetical protein